MTEVIKVEDCGENIGDYDVPIYKAVIIPKGATNGDVMKAMFPNLDFIFYTPGRIEVSGIDNHTIFSIDWWSSPYIKTEVEE